MKTDDLLKTIPVYHLGRGPGRAVQLPPHANAYVTKPRDLDNFDRIVAVIRRFHGVVVRPHRPTA